MCVSGSAKLPLPLAGSAGGMNNGLLKLLGRGQLPISDLPRRWNTLAAAALPVSGSHVCGAVQVPRLIVQSVAG